MSNVKDILKSFQNGSYSFGDNYIEDANNDLIAILDEDTGRWSYCVTGVYNSGLDSAEINVTALNRLMHLCETLKSAYGGGEQ